MGRGWADGPPSGAAREDLACPSDWSGLETRAEAGVRGVRQLGHRFLQMGDKLAETREGLVTGDLLTAAVGLRGVTE